MAVAVTPLVKRLATRAGFVARPTTERWHRAPVALLGGVAIFSAFVASTLAFATLPPLATLLLCCGAMFVLGLVDDIWQLGPLPKLAGQIAIAVAVVLAAPPLDLTGSRIVDVGLALTWIVGITNAFNLLDNVDGLAAGVAAIAGLCYLVVLWPVAPLPFLVATAAFVGATAGFLVYNFHPASIFMGDSASLFLGLFLSALGLMAVPAEGGLPSSTVVPILILLVPVFDTTFVTLTRRMAGRSPMTGGRDHTSHRLIALGVEERRAVLVHYGLTVVGGVIAFGVLHGAPGYAGVALGLYAIGLAALGIVLGHVESAQVQAGVALPDPPMLSEISYRNRALEVLLDASLAGLAYFASFAIRFQGTEFTHFLPYFARSLTLVVICQVAGLWMSGKYRQVWRGFAAKELTTILKGIAIGSAASVVVVLYLFRFIGFSRMVFVIDGVVLAAFLIGARVAVNRLDEYLMRWRGIDRRVIVYGAGRRGAMLVRDLLRASAVNLVPVGFLDDDPGKLRLRIEGLRVLGGISALNAALAKHRPAEVIVSTDQIDAERLDVIAECCRARSVRVRRLRVELEEVVLADRGEAVRHR